MDRLDDEFLREFWEELFGCSHGHTSSEQGTLQKDPLPPCSGTETLEGVQHVFTDTSQLRGAYNVYLAGYAAAHALHSLLSCTNKDNISTCSSPKDIKPIEVNSMVFLYV